MVPSWPFVSMLGLVLLVPSPAWGGRKFDVSSTNDLCSGVCEFRLCLTAGDRPRLRPCDMLSASEPAIVVRTNTSFLKLRLRGVQARLLCNRLGAPCVPISCALDDECGVGLSCLPFAFGCAMATTCPGDGYAHDTVADDDGKPTVITLSDSCSPTCEFRLCLNSQPLGPCAEGTPPDVVVRVPFMAALTDRRSFGSLVLKHERERLTLRCQPVGAPCYFPCATAAECFTGGSCSDGACRTTALCR